MRQKQYAVTSVCNALVDILIEIEETDVEKYGLTKGIMHLVDSEKQKNLLRDLRENEKTTELGGSSMNAIRALAMLRKKTVFAGMVGDDEYGDLISRRLSELGIVSKLKLGSDSTGTCLVLVTPDGERTMNTCLGASCLYGTEIVPHDEIAASEVFHFCGYQWSSEDQREGIKSAIETAKKQSTKISFDIADPFVVEMHKEDFIRTIENDADIVFANEKEAQMLYGLNPQETALQISKLGKLAVIKLGADGALIANQGKLISIPAVETKVVDTTAAGDMFAAGFLHGLTSSLSLTECGHIAASLASDVISRYGANLSQQVINRFRL